MSLYRCSRHTSTSSIHPSIHPLIRSNIKSKLRLHLNSLLRRPALHQLPNPHNNLFRFPFHPPHQLFTSRYIINKPNRQPNGPHPIVHVPNLIHNSPSIPRYEVLHIFERDSLSVRTWLGFDGENLFGDFVVEDSVGVV